MPAIKKDIHDRPAAARAHHWDRNFRSEKDALGIHAHNNAATAKLTAVRHHLPWLRPNVARKPLRLDRLSFCIDDVPKDHLCALGREDARFGGPLVLRTVADQRDLILQSSHFGPSHIFRDTLPRDGPANVRVHQDHGRRSSPPIHQCRRLHIRRRDPYSVCDHMDK